MVNLAPLYWQRDLGEPEFPTDRASFLAEFRLRAKRAKQIVEIGVGSGQSTIAFLFGLEGLSANNRLWSCDIEKPKSPIDELLDYPLWEFELGSSTDEAIRLTAPKCDILLVDGAIDNRLNDLVFYGSKVKPGGIIYVADVDQDLAKGQFDAYVKSVDIQGTQILRGYKNDMGVIYVSKD